jgi:hypothetical protein
MFVSSFSLYLYSSFNLLFCPLSFSYCFLYQDDLCSNPGMERNSSLLHSFRTAPGTQRVSDPAAAGQYDDFLQKMSLIAFYIKLFQLMLYFTHYKEKKNVLYSLLCRKPRGCITLIIYLDTNRKYTKNRLKREKYFWFSWFQMRWISKGGPEWT